MVEYIDSKHSVRVAEMPLKRSHALPQAQGGLPAASLWLNEVDVCSGGSEVGRADSRRRKGFLRPLVKVQGCLAVGAAWVRGPSSISCPG